MSSRSGICRQQGTFFLAVVMLAALGSDATTNVGRRLFFNFDTHKLRLGRGEALSRVVGFVGQTSLGAPNSLESTPDRLLANWTLTATSLEVRKNEALSSTDDEIDVYDVVWETERLLTLIDSFALASTADVHWYGGAEMLKLRWPLEKNQVSMFPYIAYDNWNGRYGSVQERYWFNTEGMAITVDDDVPLWVSLNENGSDQLVLQAQYKDSMYQNFVDLTVAKPFLRYKLWFGPTMKALHMAVIGSYFGKPTGIPDERMFSKPVWSTWVRYGKGINEQSVLAFAREIVAHGFSNSQLEIDDEWETKYGDLVIDTKKFPDFNAMVAQLKQAGFRVTMWIHPYVNLDSVTAGLLGDRPFWVRQKDGRHAYAEWWNGVALSLDPTQAAGAAWFVDRLKNFSQRTGVDSYKFDGGELVVLPSCYTINATFPNVFAAKYAEVAAQLGSLVETRIGVRTQRLPVFVRMLDRDSSWGYDNGLRSVITTSLTFSLLGYPFILPDMVGGNGSPTAELFIRWLAANVFLPSVQLSVPPWSFDDATIVAAALKLLTLRERIAPELIEIAHSTVATGEPIIRPLWWAESTEAAFSCDSEFLVGERILVAPVLDLGVTERQIYIPVGRWTSQLDSKSYDGPCVVTQKVPIDELAWFRLA